MSSRRRVLRGLIGGAVAGIASSIGLRGADAAAVKRPLGAICRKNGDCASDVCLQAEAGRNRCSCAEGDTACNGACCQTYCDAQIGCMDSLVSIPCFDQCEYNICLGMNNYFNYTFNQTYPCELYCAQQCYIS